jgi:transcription elongation factor GreA
MTETVYLTREGLDKLKNDLEHLVKVVRPKATEQMAAARAHGDLMENAEYDAARDNLSDITRRISELQQKLSKVELLDDHSIGRDDVRILSRVTLEDARNGSKIFYTIVDPLQSDPTKGLISVQSPIGKGLLGKKVGDEVTINVPSGEIHLKVLEIERSTGI